MRFALYSRKRIRRADERGYAMLLALSLTLILLISSTAIIANLRTEGKRQREEETIWRGNQYARAIQLYFHKTGHYPQTLDDLKKGLPQHHFLRQAYTDPMNKNDGSWRFIYVNAAGQIIGSTKYTSLQQMALLDSGALNSQQAPGLGTPASSLTNTSGFGGLSGGAFGNSSSGSAQNPPVALPDPNAPPQTPGGAGGGAPGQAPDPTAQNPDGTQPQAPTSGQGPGQPSGQPGASGTGIGGAGAQSPFGSLNGQPGTSIDTQKPTGPVDGPVLGAFLTGVASKVDEPSQKVYHHGKKYIQWEFIWNPLEEAAANMQQSLNPQGQQSGIGQAIGSALGLPGSSPIGSPSPGQPQQPQMPQQSPQQPQQ